MENPAILFSPLATFTLAGVGVDAAEDLHSVERRPHDGRRQDVVQQVLRLGAPVVHHAAHCRGSEIHVQLLQHASGSGPQVAVDGSPRQRRVHRAHNGTESGPLLDFLGEHSTTSENVCRHMWQEVNALMWDNRSTMLRGARLRPRRVCAQPVDAGRRNPRVMRPA